ncbi:DUF6531 domain-containing protein [Saccharopolyspora indica]|uniref:RHS repeat-associated core domain-containing protein n=1 Tax=Saccharopolyspora indica TaxID=1229659 RepID=UPI0022EAC782|nr:RHS repeat-associated core domain-containing protein [Saccharopolyspora indica]MDA3648288.1 DUF6531 domain-containing protein [Saccharopolyspora indica]
MGNPLVAEREDSTKSFSGVPILESIDETKKAIESGDWASGVMGAVGTGLDALDMALDPFGAILSAGVGWLMEHVGPLSDALDALTGDADQIKAHSETWKNVATELGEINTEMAGMVSSDVADWTGEAADSYRKRSEDTGKLIEAAKAAAEGASEGVGTAGEVVAAVRSLVRDIIAELVGSLISWALQVLATLGIAMAWVVPQVIAAVAKTVAKIADITTKLVKAMKSLGKLMKKLKDGFGDAKKALDKIKKDKGGSNDKPDSPKPDRGKGDGNGKKDNNDDPASTHSQGTGGNGSGGGNGSSDRSGGNGGSPNTDRSLGGGGSPGPNPRSPGGNPPPARSNPSGTRNQNSNPRSMDKCTTVGDPIDVATGQMIMSATDVRFENALPLEINRSHFSRYRLGRWFGRSWMSTLDERLEVDGSGISYAAADGTLQHFAHPTAGEWVTSVDGPARSLGRLDDGGYLVKDAERGCVLHFAPGTGSRLLVAMFDRNHNRIDFGYDETGAPTEIRHSTGYLVRVETANERVTALFSVAADGTEVELMRYGYADGALTELINSSGRPLRFTYDAEGRITSWTDRNGEWYRFGYDESGRCVRTEGSGGFLSGALEYDTENRITRYTDSLGHRTEFHLNEAGQVVKEVNPLGGTTESEWDAADRLLRRTDPLGRTTRHEYDDAGHLIATTRPDGSELRWERDEFGLPLAATEADGSVTRCEYDELGNLIEETDPTGARTTCAYDERGDLASFTDALGNTTRIERGIGGLPVTITDPSGAVTRFDRDQFGRATAITDAQGDVQRFGYTVSGQVIWQTDADGTTQRWAYDGGDNERAYTDELAATTRTEVANFDLVTVQTGPDGSLLRLAYDTETRLVGVTNEQGLVWRYDYDAAGNLVREVDFNGHETRYVHDAAGQLVERTDAAGEVTRFAYDELGRVVERRTGSAVARFTYDAQGHLLEAVNDDSRVSFQRDRLGRVTAETVNGRTVTSVYDALGRRVLRRTPSGAESSWEYDANSRPIALHAAGRTLRFEYDALGREVRRSLGAGMSIEQAWTHNELLRAQTVSDAAGRRSQQRSFSYRADGMLTGVQDQLTGPRTFALDHAGRVLSVQGSGWTEQYAYDAAGNLTRASWPTAADQDALGDRAYTGTVVRGAGSVRDEHDALGRMVLRHRKRLSQKPETWHYSWDSGNRLVGVRTPDGAHWRYRYDVFGRRIAKQRLAADGSVAEQVDFTWDDDTVIEQAWFEPGTPGRVTVWDYGPDGFRPLTQRELISRAPQEWVDDRFYAIVTDLVGTPTELVDEQGGIAWFQRTSTWGNPVDRARAGADIPLRFPGQYYDGETGLHYNYLRYYDPITARYTSSDPLGLAAGPNHRAYVPNPSGWSDPLGLKGKKGGGNKGGGGGGKGPCGGGGGGGNNGEGPVDNRTPEQRARDAIPNIAKKFDEMNKQKVDHIFKGELNKDGKPTGFHAYTNGRPPQNVQIQKTTGDPSDVHKIDYTNSDAAKDKKGNLPVKTSTMYPNTMTPDQIKAYNAADNPNSVGGHKIFQDNQTGPSAVKDVIVKDAGLKDHLDIAHPGAGKKDEGTYYPKMPDDPGSSGKGKGRR